MTITMNMTMRMPMRMLLTSADEESGSECQCKCLKSLEVVTESDDSAMMEKTLQGYQYISELLAYVIEC